MSKIKTEDLDQIGNDLDVLFTEADKIRYVKNLNDSHTLYCIEADCKLIYRYLKWLSVVLDADENPKLQENIDKIQRLIAKLGSIENTLPVI